MIDHFYFRPNGCGDGGHVNQQSFHMFQGQAGDHSSKQCKNSAVDNAGAGARRPNRAWGRHAANLWQACPGHLVLLESYHSSARGHPAQSIAQSSRVQRANRQSRYKKWANFIRKQLQSLKHHLLGKSRQGGAARARAPLGPSTKGDNAAALHGSSGGWGGQADGCVGRPDSTQAASVQIERGRACFSRRLRSLESVNPSIVLVPPCLETTAYARRGEDQRRKAKLTTGVGPEPAVGLG